MAAPEIEERWGRNSNLLFETMQFLANRGEPVHKLEIEKHLRDVQPPTADEEIVRSTNGAQSWLNWFHWRTVAFSKVGWISKQRGNWSITDQGRQALARFTTPAALWSEADRLYGEAKPSQRVYLVRGSSVSGVNLVHDLWLR